MSSNTETPTSLRDEYESSPVLYRLNETQNDTNEKINFESIQSQNTANKISLFFQQDSIGHSTPTPSNPSNTQALLKSEQKLSVVGRTSIFRTVEQLLLVLKENGLKELNEQKLLSLFTKDEMHRLLSTKGSYIPKSTSKPSMTHTLLRSIGRGLFEKEFSKLFEEFPILPDCKDHKPGFLDGAELTFLNCDDSKWQMANEASIDRNDQISSKAGLDTIFLTTNKNCWIESTEANHILEAANPLWHLENFYHDGCNLQKNINDR